MYTTLDKHDKSGMEKKKHTPTQKDAPFVAFYDKHAVTFVLTDEMADALITGLQLFILIPQSNHMGSHRPSDFRPKPFTSRKKNKMCM